MSCVARFDNSDDNRIYLPPNAPIEQSFIYNSSFLNYKFLDSPQVQSNQQVCLKKCKRPDCESDLVGLSFAHELNFAGLMYTTQVLIYYYDQMTSKEEKAQYPFEVFFVCFISIVSSWFGLSIFRNTKRVIHKARRRIEKLRNARRKKAIIYKTAFAMSLRISTVVILFILLSSTKRFSIIVPPNLHDLIANRVKLRITFNWFRSILPG